MKLRRGFLLPLVLVVIFILAVLAMALMTQGQLVHTLSVGERVRVADLTAVQVVETMAAIELDKGRQPPDLEAGPARIRWSQGCFYQKPRTGFATFKNVFPGAEHEPWGSGEPDPTASPSVARATFQPQTASTARVSLGPDHTFVCTSLGDRRDEMVLSDLFPYAAYAPMGSLEVEQAVSYANPNYGEAGRPDGHDSAYPEPAALTGLPVRLLARDAVRVGDLPYGQILSSHGPILVDRGRALCRTGPLGPQSYGPLIATQVKTAIDELSKLALDKTKLMIGANLSGAGVLELFKKGGLDPTRITAGFFSLEQAIRFPVPIIPTYKTGGAVIGDVLNLHVPLPCDNGIQQGSYDARKIDELAKRNDELMKDYNRDLPAYRQAKAEYEAAKQALENDKPENDDDPRVQDVINKKQAMDDAQKPLLDAMAERDRNIREMGAITQDWRNFQVQLDNANSAMFGRAPRTEEEEKAIQTFGWAYFRLGGELIQLLKSSINDLIQGHPEHILDTITAKLVYPTRLVNLAGGPVDLWPAGQDRQIIDLITTPRPQGENGSDNIPMGFHSLKATWSVPAGRAVKLEGNWEFRGDLWLRRGSLMVVQGDLRLTAPAAWDGWENLPAAPGERPSGRLVLEEGATLIVSGNADFQGTAQDGSIMVATPYGGAPMLTSSVLCTGDLKLRYGVHSGVLIADLLAVLGKEGRAVAKVQGTLKQLTSRFAPHLSKLPVLGPFNYRKCWYADWATTFVIIPELAELGLQGPWPIPLPNKNCLKTPFKYVSIGYTLNLSLWLGEHLLTQAKTLWPWGKGMVPVFGKVDPRELADQLNELPMDEIEREALNEGLLTLLKEILPEVIADFLEDLLKEQVLEMLKPLNDGCGGKEDKEPKGFKKVIEFVKNSATQLGKLKKVWSLYSKTRSKISQYVKAYVMREFRSGTSARLPLKEVGGAFLSAGGTLEVGSASGFPSAPLAAGFFVAGQQLTVNADIMVGTLLSYGGDIKARKLYAFPYFSRVSLYSPKYFDNVFAEAWQCPIPEGSGATQNIGRPVYHVTARGWERER